MTWLFIAIVLLLIVGVSGWWLFRQRTPEEFKAARDRLKRHIGKR